MQVKGTMYMVDFEVEGRGEFPFDMLRYDSCWPVSSADVDAMQRNGERRTIQLRCWRERRARVSTADRWASFNWRVTREDDWK